MKIEIKSFLTEPFPRRLGLEQKRRLHFIGKKFCQNHKIFCNPVFLLLVCVLLTTFPNFLFFFYLQKCGLNTVDIYVIPHVLEN